MTGHHFWQGFLLCLVLNALAVAAALGVTLRAKLAGRAERALAVLMGWNFLVICPVYALGLTDRLTARALAWVSAPFFLLVLAAARGRRPVGGFFAEIGRAALEMAFLPFEAVRVCARARSLVAIGALFTFAMVVWGVWCTYLTPSWKQWDALWYHEPMIGFAIQNHGFAMVDLPAGGAQKINGYPRLCEMTYLWVVIFTDRRFIDVVGWVAAPGLALSVYAMARRYTADPILPVASACVLLLMPACVRIFGSTYVDAHNAAFVVAAAHFATRPPRLRVRDALLAAVCLALAVASKSMALVPVAILSLVAAGRLLAGVRRRPLAVLGAIALGVALIGGSAATVYLRDWVHFGNPFWPDLKYDNAKLGIHWPGAYDWGTHEYARGENRIDMNLPMGDFLRELYSIPYYKVMSHYDQMWEYGIAVTWVLVPLLGVAFVALSLALVRGAVRRAIGEPDGAWDGARNVAPIAATLAAILWWSPALYSARYQDDAVALALVVVAWLLGGRAWGRLAEGLAGAMTAMSFASFFWMTPRTWLTWSEAKAFAKIPYPKRELTLASAISPTLPPWDGSPVMTDVGLAREKQLGPGAVLAFPDAYGDYMALFWNNTFSNRVVYVRSGPDYMQRLMKTKAAWAYCQAGDPTCAPLARPGSGWERVGQLDLDGHGSVYRRTRW